MTDETSEILNTFAGKAETLAREVKKIRESGLSEREQEIEARKLNGRLTELQEEVEALPESPLKTQVQDLFGVPGEMPPGRKNYLEGGQLRGSLDNVKRKQGAIQGALQTAGGNGTLEQREAALGSAQKNLDTSLAELAEIGGFENAQDMMLAHEAGLVGGADKIAAASHLARQSTLLGDLKQGRPRPLDIEGAATAFHKDPTLSGMPTEQRAQLEEGHNLLPWKRICKLFENKVLQRRHPGWKETLDSCAVFDMCGVNEEALKEHFEPEHLDMALPFPTVAFINDYLFVVVKNYWAKDTGETADGSGLGVEILGVVCPYTELASEFEFVVSGRIEWLMENENMDYYGFQGSHIYKDKPCRIERDEYGEPEFIPYSGTEPDPALKSQVLKDILIWFTGYLGYMNQKDNFIVADHPKKFRKSKKGKIPRMHSRSRYMVVKKGEIKKRYLDSQPSGRKPTMPHLRRGHYRTLTSPRYHQQGQRVWVRPSHIKGNEVEWREGDRFYKVL